jgi:hypothetical protein
MSSHDNDNVPSNVKPFPRPAIKRPSALNLVLPPGVTRIPPAPIKSAGGEEWKSALDCLKELVHDIEAGRVAAPEMIYVAMRTVHKEPNDPRNWIGYPSYSWMAPPQGHMAESFVGLLENHKDEILYNAKRT